MKKKEIEVKYRIENKEKLKSKLESLGGKIKDVIFQRTYSLFMPNYEMANKGIFLRVREDNGKATFTIKVKKGNNAKFYERDEYNIDISDAEKTIEMLKLLGFSKLRIFEKRREVWKLPNKNIEICIDILPFAQFIEIEGTKQEIEDTIFLLELRGERITEAYWRVYEKYCKENNLKIKNDILFN